MTSASSPSRLTQAFTFVASKGVKGATWMEYADRYGLHHGQASGALSVLHHSGYIARLREKREGCGIYVPVTDVQGRPTVPHKQNKMGASSAAVLLLAMMTECVQENVHDDECWRKHAGCALLRAAEMIYGAAGEEKKD